MMERGAVMTRTAVSSTDDDWGSGTLCLPYAEDRRLSCTPRTAAAFGTAQLPSVLPLTSSPSRHHDTLPPSR
jgi:hypothetical protein